jgi:hypothetical protein
MTSGIWRRIWLGLPLKVDFDSSRVHRSAGKGSIVSFNEKQPRQSTYTRCCDSISAGRLDHLGIIDRTLRLLRGE